MTGQESQIDFEHIDILFRRLGLAADPAECHGSLCGLLCATEMVQGAAWVNQVLNGQWGLSEAEVDPAQQAVDAETRDLLLSLYEETAAQLDDPEYGFSPLLPDDDVPMAQRVAALSRWCQGFLLGLGLGGVQEQSGLSEESREVLQDFVEISRLGSGEGGEGDEDETAYAEIVEYVRMAALLIYEELRPLRAVRPEGAPVH